MTETKWNYMFAWDKKLKKRVIHRIVGDYAISLITGSKFRVKKRKKNAPFEITFEIKKTAFKILLSLAYFMLFFFILFLAFLFVQSLPSKLTI